MIFLNPLILRAAFDNATIRINGLSGEYIEVRPSGNVVLNDADITHLALYTSMVSSAPSSPYGRIMLIASRKRLSDLYDGGSIINVDARASRYYRPSIAFPDSSPVREIASRGFIMQIIHEATSLDMIRPIIEASNKILKNIYDALEEPTIIAELLRRGDGAQNKINYIIASILLGHRNVGKLLIPIQINNTQERDYLVSKLPEFATLLFVSSWIAEVFAKSMRFANIRRMGPVRIEYVGNLRSVEYILVDRRIDRSVMDQLAKTLKEKSVGAFIGRSSGDPLDFGDSNELIRDKLSKAGLDVDDFNNRINTISNTGTRNLIPDISMTNFSRTLGISFMPDKSETSRVIAPDMKVFLSAITIGSVIDYAMRGNRLSIALKEALSVYSMM